tara:strand:+ start:6665 stop:7234 length:570 start_codon:yes stop_codon:yes gene_type:complete
MKKIRGYPLNKDQVFLLRTIKKNKNYRYVPSNYKGMLTISIKKKRIITNKHLFGITQVIKQVNDKLLGQLNISIDTENIKEKTKPFNLYFCKNLDLDNKQNHKNYVKSFIWRNKRKYLLKKRGIKCEDCGYIPNDSKYLHIHHRTYRRWGHEHQRDLKILCENCHNIIHDNFTIKEIEDLYTKEQQTKS